MFLSNSLSVCLSTITFSIPPDKAINDIIPCTLTFYILQTLITTIKARTATLVSKPRLTLTVDLFKVKYNVISHCCYIKASLEVGFCAFHLCSSAGQFT